MLGLRMSTVFAFAAGALGTAAVMACMMRNERDEGHYRGGGPRRRPDDRGGPGDDRGRSNYVREAGPEAMSNPGDKRNWDAVDEASDESFPASDPPANY